TTDNSIVRWDGTDGYNIQDSSIIIDNSNNITGVISINGVIIENHALRHENGGADEIDGYNIAVTYAPMNYDAPLNNILGEHLFQIDDELNVIASSVVTDHGALIGLADDDHTQYLLVSGTRALSGSLDLGTNNIINVGTVDGVDISSHSTRHESGGVDEIQIENLSTLETNSNFVLRPNGSGGLIWLDLNNITDGYVYETRQVIAGNGLTGGGDLSTDITLNVTPHADGSIVISSNDIRIGVLASDSQHGNLGGGSLHDVATALQDGFFSSDGYSKLESIEVGAQANTVNSVFGRTGVIVAVSGDYDSDEITNVSAISGVTVSDALEMLNSLIVGGGSGTVTGPSSTTDNAIVRWSGTDGYTIQNSGIIIDDSDNITNVTTINGVTIQSHSTRHESGGADVIDGYNVSLTYSPSNYNSPINNLIGEHLYQIDEALGNISDSVVTDHGALTGLSDDDHTQYLLVTGSQAITGSLDGGPNYIPNVGNAKGVEVPSHSPTHASGGANEIDGYNFTLTYSPSNYNSPINNLIGEHLYQIDEALANSSGVTDHGALTGLSDDDHTQYLLVNGSRAMTGSLDMGTNNITNVGNVDGVDVSSHSTRHESGGADEIDGYNIALTYSPSNYNAPINNLIGEHLYQIDEVLGNLGSVGSVFGRTGIVTAQPGDYDSDEITNVSAISGATVSDALETLNSLIVGGGGGGGTVLGPGSTTDNAIVRWDGTDGYTIQNSVVTISNSGDLAGLNTAVFGAEGDAGNSGTSITIDFSTLGQKVKVTLTDNTTFSFTFPGVGNYILKLFQDGTGGRTVTMPSSSRAAGGTLGLAGAANSVTVWAIYYDGTNSYLSSMPGTGSSAPTVTLV